MAHGIARDRPGKLPRWEVVTKELVYYGDLSNEFLWGEGRTYDIAADTRSRRVTLDDLKAWPASGFTKARYRKLPGKTALKEFFAGSLSRPLNWFGLSDELIAVVAPDMAHYWNLDSEFGTEARLRLSVALRAAFDRGDRVMIVAHSLGSIIAYDVLWKLSRSAEFRDYWSKRID